jgi:hypothetical protein
MQMQNRQPGRRSEDLSSFGIDVLNRWHESHAPANIPVTQMVKTAYGIETIEKLRKAILPPKNPPPKGGSRRPATAIPPSWGDVPELYRKMIVRAAGLGADVVVKRDRDLSETEKVMIRAAVADMRSSLNSLAAF